MARLMHGDLELLKKGTTMTIEGLSKESSEKRQVKDFWETAACGEALYLGATTATGYSRQAEIRYHLEPEILTFAECEKHRGQRVLEIGVGLGADHQKWAEAGAELYGIDLTERAVAQTQRRLALFGLRSQLQTGDAECLPFPDDFFDVVYSWGVLMATPNTSKAIQEIYRVLKAGGLVKVMLYHKYSVVGLMLWIRYALLRGRPFTSLDKIYANYLESPGMRAYTVPEARALFAAFKMEEIRTFLCHGDLLSSAAGQRHRGLLLNIARAIWPRRLIKVLFPRYGLFMTIRTRK